LNQIEVAGVALVIGALPNADGEALANLADREAQKRGSAVVVLGGASGGKVQFVAKVTADLVGRGAHAGNLLREVAKVAGGGGGGRPDFAQAGGRDASKLQEALERAKEVLETQLKGQ
jgi:alanyl-tRNA synthetase